MQRCLYLFLILGSKLKFVLCEELCLSVELDDKSESWVQGTRHEIICKGTSKNQKIYWESPSGEIIDRRHLNSRVYVQERLTNRATAPALALVITKAKAGDTGVWACRDGTFAQTVEICVIDVAEFINSKTEVIVDEFGAITLSCEARGFPEPRIVWHRGTEVIIDEEPNSSKYKLAIKYNEEGYGVLLTIMSLEAEDAGIYTCEAVQQYAQYPYCSLNNTEDFHLFVNYKPKMEYDMNEIILVYASENDTAQIICHSDGYPKPSYKWYIQFPIFDEEVPQSMIALNDSASVLSVQANQSTYYNLYKCVASNSYGEHYNVFKLVPGVKPEIPEVELVNASDTSIIVNIKTEYMDVTSFGVEIMYKSRPFNQKPYTEFDWENASVTETVVNGTSFTSETVSLAGVEPQTSYWIRARTVIANMGVSSWSQPILAVTAEPIGLNGLDAENAFLFYNNDVLYVLVCVVIIVAIVLFTIVLLKKM